jgi:hypothetical protein
MIPAPTARRPALVDANDLRLALAVPGLVLLGFYAISDPRVSAALVGVVAMAAWIAFAYRRPRTVLIAALPMLLLAGTKFRYRDSTASLAGELDTQILLELLLFAFIGVGVAGAWLATRSRRRLSAAEAVILAYAGFAVLSTAWSAAPELTLVRSTQLTIVSLLAIVAVRVLTPPVLLWGVLRATGWFVAACALVAAALPWTTGPLFPDEGVFRFRWFAVHPLEAATLCGIVAVGYLAAAAFARSTHAPSRRAGRLSALFVLFALGMLVTSSRGPLIALAGAIGAVWFLKLRPALRVAAILATSAAALVAVAYSSQLFSLIENFSNQDSVLTRMIFRAQTADDLLELNGRIGLWTDLSPIVADNLVIGSGYQASRAALLDVADWAAYAHNAILQTALDLGVLGTASVLALIAMGLSAGFSRGLNPWMRGTVAALTVFLTLNSLSNESFAAAPDVELFMLFVCALCWGHAKTSARVDQTP